MSRKTKIVATLGPVSESVERIEALARAGMDACRLNFSFGTAEEHLQKVRNIREVSRKLGRPLAVLQDLQGPKIRIGQLDSEVTVHENDVLVLSGDREHRPGNVLPTTYADIALDVRMGDPILLADGSIHLEVIHTDREKRQVRCRVLNGGTILTGKGINLPQTDISIPALTEKDRRDARVGARAGVDYVALSFVRQPQDIRSLRAILEEEGRDIPIIAKIEKPQALVNLDAILEEADGVMVARGDLAVEISLARVPMEQKEIIERSNRKGKITIIATHMLESMVESPVPTRAEASDVANAVLDGTDAVMLSAETSIGRYPDRAVRTMAEIIRETERSRWGSSPQVKLELPEGDTVREAICSAAAHLSHFLDEKALMVFTRSGATIRVLSKYRPQSNIYGITHDEDTYHRMALNHNVMPILMERREVEESLRVEAERELLRRGIVQPGDRIILVSGEQRTEGWHTNSVTVETIRE